MASIKIAEPNHYSLRILGALQAKPMYLDTVSADTKARRRAANRVARRSRRINRKGR